MAGPHDSEFLKQLAEFKEGAIESQTSPSICQIELTNACTMSCVMCPRKKMSREVGYISLGLFRKIVDELVSITSASGCYRPFRLHHFGESLLHPQLGPILSYLKGKGLVVGMSINPGELTDDRIKAVCDGGLSLLEVSVDGLSDAQFKGIRGPNADLALAERNVLKLVDYKRKNSLRKPHIKVQMILMKGTEGNVDEFKRKWLSLGVDSVKIKPFSRWNGDDSLINSFSIGSSRPVAARRCSFPWSSLTVLWDGRVVPCCYDYDGLCVLGDLNRESLVDVWNGKPMQMLRQLHAEGKLSSIRLCRHCADQLDMDPFFPFKGEI